MITSENKFGIPYNVMEPMKHQADILQVSRQLDGYALFWEMGCAKTKPIIDTIAYLFSIGEIDGVIIISDNGAYRIWNDDQIPKHLMPELPTRQLVWTSHMSSEEKARAGLILTAKNDMLDIVSMNVEGFSSQRSIEYALAFCRSHYTLVIVDESSSIKNLKSKRTENIMLLGRQAPFRRILTGTPITQGPLDLYSQMEFVKPGCMGFKSFVAFRAYYAEMIMTKLPRCPRPFYEITGYKNLDVLSKTIAPYSSRLLKTDCMDLPEKVYEMHYIEHTDEQRRIYHEIKSEAVAMLKSGMITVTSALTALIRLQQVNCGFVMQDDKIIAEIPSNRLKELIYLCELIGGKITIWATFQYDIRKITEELKKTFGDRSTVSYYGETNSNDRVLAIDRFVGDSDCRFFVSNPATGGKAITLTCSHQAIYYSNSYHLERRLQSEDRNHRKGQTNKCTYTDIVVPKTVDTKILSALKEKKDLAHEVLDRVEELFVD